MTARGFLKLAVTQSIKSLGGIAGGERATGLGSSQVGRWNNINDRDLPRIDYAVALDEAALACGGRARILEAMAAELGHVAFPVPESHGETREVTLQLANATAEFGQIAQAVVAGLGDGQFDNRERSTIVAEIDDAMIALARLRATVIGEEPTARPVRAV